MKFMKGTAENKYLDICQHIDQERLRKDSYDKQGERRRRLDCQYLKNKKKKKKKKKKEEKKERIVMTNIEREGDSKTASSNRIDSSLK